MPHYNVVVLGAGPGGYVAAVRAAAEAALAGTGVDACAQPWDGRRKRLLVAEECSGVGCIGQRIAAILAEEGHEPQRLTLCNLGRRFIEQGSVGELYRQCGLDAESLARTAKEVCQ